MNLQTPIRRPGAGSAARKIETGLGKADLLRLLRTMLRIRQFEIRTRELFQQGKVKGTAHSSVGQEAIAAGASFDLGASDFVVSNHRGHGHVIAKGGDPKLMMAELMGKVDGYCQGLGGSMHIADMDLNILGANGIVGASMGIGAGAALAAHLRRSGECGIAYFGDGAASEGLFHEALNLASIWKLPILFMCENNQYHLSTPSSETIAGGGIARRAEAYAMPGHRIDGNDVIAVRETAREAIERARAGEGPTLIEAMTYRWDDHSMRANLPAYRADAEVELWREEADPVTRLEALLKQKRWLSEAARKKLHEEVAAELEEAVAWAERSPEPTSDLFERTVYAPRHAHVEPNDMGANSRQITYAEALKEAIGQEMERDEGVFVLGEDVGKIGGIFGVTRGLRERFGDERLRDTPIAEQVIAGCGVGAAALGMRPIVEIQIFDFVTFMMDMIVNQAAKFRFMLGGKPKMPLVFRGPQGGGIRMAAQHSQSLEAWFTNVPGLTVLAPSGPYEAKGLLTAAIRDDNPVIFLEHKMLYLGGAAGVPEMPYAIPIGKAAVKRAGSDVTIVATLAMVERAMQAAVLLERDGISAEVIDPRTLAPLDTDTILDSVRKTNRLVVAHEGRKFGGFGAEIASMVVEHAFDHLDAPILRLGMPDVPMPYNDKLEREVIPDQEDIATAVRSMIHGD